MLYAQLSIFFILGYLAIIFEKWVRINKAAIALLMAVGCWIIYFANVGAENIPKEHLAEVVSDVAQIVFFLMAVMSIVELIDSHHGFKVVTDLIKTNSKRKILWLLLIISFFLSSVIDNLTTMIVMVSLIKKLVSNRNDRWLYGSLVVISANAGGAWTPIGDVTTTMLWIGEKITTWQTIKLLFLPSVVCAVVSGLLMSIFIKGVNKNEELLKHRESEPGALMVLLFGLGALLMIPIWKSFLGIPPFLGAIIGLALLWLITDIYHQKHGDHRYHLTIPHILTKIDVSSVLFFLGILLAVSSLTMAGILQDLAETMERVIPNQNIVALIIGLVSSIVDNVPLVAATMGMYGPETYPIDAPLWQLIAYAAGTGGSILIIGSAAGVAFMGLEKVDFIWYFKRISWIALVGFAAGAGIFFLIYPFLV